MIDKKTLAILESMTGIMACQNVLFQLLTKEGIIKREEIGLILDSLIENFDKQNPNNNITRPIKSLRESINKAAPFQYPDWLRDITEGGCHGET